MTSKNRKFRTKQSTHGINDDEPGSAAAPKAIKKPSLLSFGDDDELSAPPKPKAKASKSKSAKLHIPTPAAAVDVVTQRSQAGEYTADKLKELRGNALHFSTSKVVQPAAVEPIIKLSGSFKALAAKDDRFSMSSSMVVDTGATLQTQPAAVAAAARTAPAGPSAGVSSGAAATNGRLSTVTDATQDEDEDGFAIPDEEMIRRAKEKRGRLRQATLAPDYIPLGGASMLTSKEYKSAQEGDGGEGGGSETPSDDELEADMRLKFAASAEPTSRPDKGGYSAVALPEDEADDDEDFASAQLRKAIRRNQGADTAAAPAVKDPGDYRGRPAAGGAGALQGASTANLQAVITSSGDAVVKALRDTVDRLQLSNRQASANLARTTANLEGALTAITRVERDIQAASERYVRVQQLRTYIGDLCDCLQHKAVVIEELEDQHMGAMEERAAAHKEARQIEDQELLRCGEAAVSACLDVLSRSGARAAGAAAADNAWNQMEVQLATASGSGQQQQQPQVDEFGRTLGLSQQRDAQERAAKRRRVLEGEVQQLAQLARGDTLATVAAGDDDEPEGAADRYVNRRQELLEAAGTVFADADEEFASLAAVKQRLEAWKLQHPKEYNTAYVGMSAPLLFAPYIRLELLHLDPLYDPTAPGFDQQRWYELLFDYGMPADPAAAAAVAAATADNDPDGELVPKLVQQLVLPQAAHVLARCWLPGDPAQAASIARLVGDLLVYVPTEEERMSELLSLLQGSLEAAVDACRMPPWPSSAAAAVPRATGVLFRTAKRAVALLRSLAAFEGLLSRQLLTRLGLGQLLKQQLTPYIRASFGEPAAAVALVEAVCGAIPPVWVDDSTEQELRPFRDMVAALNRLLQSMDFREQPQATSAQLQARLLQSLSRVGLGNVVAKHPHFS